MEDLEGIAKCHVFVFVLFSREIGNWRKKDDLEAATCGIEKGHVALLTGKI